MAHQLDQGAQRARVQTSRRHGREIRRRVRVQGSTVAPSFPHRAPTSGTRSPASLPLPLASRGRPRPSSRRPGRRPFADIARTGFIPSDPSSNLSSKPRAQPLDEFRGLRIRCAQLPGRTRRFCQVGRAGLQSGDSTAHAGLHRLTTGAPPTRTPPTQAGTGDGPCSLGGGQVAQPAKPAARQEHKEGREEVFSLLSLVPAVPGLSPVCPRCCPRHFSRQARQETCFLTMT